jgi:hypothetical protein
VPCFQIGLCAVALHLLAVDCATAQVLWKEPAQMTAVDWVWGPGGVSAAPRPPFRFVKEIFSGVNAKIEVIDSADRAWVVTFGGGLHADTFAARFLYALGYAAIPTVLVRGTSIDGVHDLKRAKPFVAEDGTIHDAQFKLDKRCEQRWSWNDPRFIDSRELGGLKIVMMLLSNWDSADARDGLESNNAICGEPPIAGKSGGRFAVTDWSSSLGRTGGFFNRDRWNWRGYRDQTSDFAVLRSDCSIKWGFQGKHDSDIVNGVGIEDVRWLMPYLSRITDEELATGLAASGASDFVGQQFTLAIRQRIRELQRIAATGSDIGPRLQRD